MLFGAADYAAAAHCRLNSRALWQPRSVLAVGASAAGLPAIDSPSLDLRDPDGLAREAEEAAELGYLGKVGIHPRQLLVIQEAFRPTTQELAAARAVVAAAGAVHGEITTVDVHMIGPPLVAAARAITDRADAMPASATFTEARTHSQVCRGRQAQHARAPHEFLREGEAPIFVNSGDLVSGGLCGAFLVAPEVAFDSAGGKYSRAECRRFSLYQVARWKIIRSTWLKPVPGLASATGSSPTEADTQRPGIGEFQ